MTPIRQIAAHPGNGFLVALRLDGSLVRQKRNPDTAAHAFEWKAVPTEELPARAVQVAIGHTGLITVMLADGRLFEELPVELGRFRAVNWREIEGPKE